MATLWKKQKAIISDIEKYFSCVDECSVEFKTCMTDMIINGIKENNREVVHKVSHLESEADDLRRGIEHKLYEKALVPESRGDILGLLESVDKIPNMFESICYQVYQEKLEFPTEWREKLTQLVEKNLEAYRAIKNASIGFFYNKVLKDTLKEVDSKESESDNIERDLIEAIFNSKIDKADKILLKEVVINIGNISDLALATADRLTIAVIKRRI